MAPTTAKWAYDSALENARAELVERYPGEKIDILEAFDIAYVGWEADCQGALIAHDGVPELVIVDSTGNTKPVPEHLVDQLTEYRRLITDTEAVLERYRAMGGIEGPALVEAHEKHHQWLISRDRREGETDQEFEFRHRLFAEGRLSVRVEDLPESVVDRLREVEQSLPYFEIGQDVPDAMFLDAAMRKRETEERGAAAIEILESLPSLPPEPGDEMPDDELIAFGSGNVARDLGIPNPEATTFKWHLVRILALAMVDRNLDAAAVAELAGETEPAQIDRITRGLVRDVDSYEIMRLLKALGHRIVIEAVAPEEGRDGDIWIERPDEKVEDRPVISRTKRQLVRAAVFALESAGIEQADLAVSCPSSEHLAQIGSPISGVSGSSFG